MNEDLYDINEKPEKDEIEESNIKHQGYLLKRSQWLMNWSWRQTILTAKELLTYKDQEDGAEPTCVFETSKMIEVQQYQSYSQSQHGFCIYMTDQTVQFEAESQGKRSDWIKSIQSIISSKKSTHYPIYQTSWSGKFINSQSQINQKIKKRKTVLCYINISVNKTKNINKTNIIQFDKVKKEMKQVLNQVNMPRTSVKDPNGQFQNNDDVDITGKLISCAKMSHLRMISVREVVEENKLSNLHQASVHINQLMDGGTINQFNIPKMPNLPNVPSIPNNGKAIPTIPGLPGKVSSIPGKVLNVPSIPGKVPNVPSIPGLPGKVPSIPGLPGKVPSIPGLPGKVPSIPGKVPTIPGKVPTIPGKVPIAPNDGLNRNRCMSVQNIDFGLNPMNFFKKTQGELNPIYLEAKLVLKDQQKDKKFETFNWSDISINKKNINNVFNESEISKDIVKNGFLRERYIFFLDAFSFIDDPNAKSLKRNSVALKSNLMKNLFTYKEIFSAKLSQSFMITIAKLNKTHPDLIQKLNNVSNEISIEDLKAISELFSVRSKHKSELEELLNYQVSNNLEFESYRASEKFVLDILFLIQPKNVKIDIPRLEFVDARFRTWKYALDFMNNLEYIVNTRDTIFEVVGIIRSEAMTDIIRLTLFYGNLLNASKPSQKEIKCLQLDSLFKLFKYKNSEGSYFYDEILLQVEYHLNQIEKIPMHKLCMCFDESNSGLKSILTMINDFIAEYQKNLNMIEQIKMQDVKQKKYIDQIFQKNIMDKATIVFNQPKEIEQSIKSLQSWFGFKEDGTECKNMDPIFKIFSIFLSHLQSRIKVIRSMGTFKDKDSNKNEMHKDSSSSKLSKNKSQRSELRASIK